eukprot:2196822-Pyramimonas_sp.AAC.1
MGAELAAPGDGPSEAAVDAVRGEVHEVAGPGIASPWWPCTAWAPASPRRVWPPPGQKLAPMPV